MSSLAPRTRRRQPARTSIDLDHELTEGFAQKFIRHKTRQLVGRCGFTPTDREELDQELKLRLLERFPQFDPQKSDWPAFVTTVIERQIATLLESRCRLKRYGDGNAVSLSEETSSEEGLATELGDQVTLEQSQSLTREFDRSDFEWAELEHDVAVVLDQLPPEERAVCEALQHGNIAQVARRLNIPRTTLQSLVARLRTKFAANGLRDFL